MTGDSDTARAALAMYLLGGGELEHAEHVFEPSLVQPALPWFREVVRVRGASRAKLLADEAIRIVQDLEASSWS